MLPLLLTIMSDAALARLPPECPWDQVGFAVMLPGYSASIPVNASFWVRAYGEVDPVITELASSSSIAAERIDVALESTGGTLIQLRPEALLQPGRRYETNVAGWQSTSAAETDDRAPATPIVGSFGPITSAYDACPTAGVLLNLRDPGEPLIYLIEDADDGSVLEISSEFSQVVIPTEPDTAVRFRVVAVDIAGNRSEATSPIDAMSGAVPDPVSFDVDSGDDGLFGCVCLRASAPTSIWLLLALGLLLSTSRSWGSRRRSARSDS